MNHKRVYRLYCLEGLRMRSKRPRRHVSSRRREIRPLASRPDERWAMDFMSDELFDGRRIRLLTLVDHFTRESLAIEVDGRLGGQRVVEVLARLALGGRKPKTISMDNGALHLNPDSWAGFGADSRLLVQNHLALKPLDKRENAIFAVIISCRRSLKP